jgi:hypothetical protein
MGRTRHRGTYSDVATDVAGFTLVRARLIAARSVGAMPTKAIPIDDTRGGYRAFTSHAVRGAALRTSSDLAISRVAHVACSADGPSYLARAVTSTEVGGGAVTIRGARNPGGTNAADACVSVCALRASSDLADSACVGRIA